MEAEGTLPHSHLSACSNVSLYCKLFGWFFFSGSFVVNILAVCCTAVFKFQFHYDIYGSLGLTRNPNYVAAVCTVHIGADGWELQAGMQIPLSWNVCIWYRTKGEKNERSNTDRFMYLLQTRPSPSQQVRLLRHLTVWPWENGRLFVVSTIRASY
jgi:hypothetical protein